MAVWILFVILFATIKDIAADNLLAEELLQEPMLTKSLGYSIRRDLDSKTLIDAKLNKEFTYQYQEMLKASRESFENVSGREDKRLRRVVGEQNYEMMKEAGVLDRRRSAPRLESPVGKRRARTQALRRQKLNNQSLNSHLQHARQTTAESDTSLE